MDNIEVGKRNYCVLFTYEDQYAGPRLYYCCGDELFVCSTQTRVSSAVWVIIPPVLYVYPVICMWE